MKKVIVFLVLFSTVLLVITGWTVYNRSDQKIVVIDSNKVLEGYKGFQEAQDIFEKEISSLDESLQKQTKLFDKRRFELESKYKDLTKEERGIAETELRALSLTVSKLKSGIDKKRKEEENKLLHGVYNKVDSFIQRYSELNNITLVLGATGIGNVVYKSQKVDKTEEIIKLLNQEYLNGVE